MNFIIDNWYMIIALLCIVVLTAINIQQFAAKPTEEQKEKVRQWLLIAVTECEAQLGSKTGQLKLSLCYDMFVNAFPALAAIMPFSMFSALVDEALEKMQSILEDQPQVLERMKTTAY